MDRTAIEELQMHGQDIPWLLAALGHPQARPPGPGLGSARGRRPPLDLRRAARRHPGPGRGAGRAGRRPWGTRCSSTPRTRPRCSWPGWPAPRSARSRSRPTPARWWPRSPTSPSTPAASPPSPTPATPTRWPRPRRRSQWIAVIPDERRTATRRAGAATAGPTDIPFAALVGDAGAWTGRPDRADAAVRHHVHLGHDQPAQGGGAHPRQRDLGQPRRAPQHRPGHRRPVPDLPARSST